MIKEELKYYNVVCNIPNGDYVDLDMKVLFSEEDFIEYVKSLPEGTKYEAEKVMEVIYVPDKAIDMDRVIEDLSMEMREQM